MAELEASEEINDFGLLHLGESIDISRYDVERINQKNVGGWTLLMYACNRGLKYVVEQLVEKGAELQARSYDDATALMIACAAGDVAIVELVMHRAHLELADNRGWTALFYSVFYGRESCVERLLLHGASPHAVNKIGQTPMHLAITYGMNRTVALLVESGAPSQDYLGVKSNNIDIKSPAAKTPNARTLLNDFFKSRRTFTPNKRRLPMNNENVTPTKTRSKSPSSWHLQTPTKLSNSRTLATKKVKDTKTTCNSKAPSILDFLTELQLAKYYPIFRDEEVDFTTFLTFDVDNLKEIGISLYGPRRKIMLAIEEYRTYHGITPGVLKKSSW